MAIVKIRSRAEEDLYEIWYYIAVKNKSPLNAKRFISKFDKIFKALALKPDTGRARFEFANNIYQYPLGDYLIFYFPIDKGVEIVRVLHGAGNLPEIL